MAPKTTNLTILFADISGSTRLYEVLGDAPARAKVANCLQMLTEATQRHGGTVIKTIGDEIMCTFPSAENACNAACEMHELVEDDITEQTAAGPVSLAIRIGIHHGPAILEGGDVFGDAVNVAARMASMSKAGQIITTQMTIDELSPVLKASSRFIDRAPVKGNNCLGRVERLRGHNRVPTPPDKIKANIICSSPNSKIMMCHLGHVASCISRRLTRSRAALRLANRIVSAGFSGNYIVHATHLPNHSFEFHHSQGTSHFGGGQTGRPAQIIDMDRLG